MENLITILFLIFMLGIIGNIVLFIISFFKKDFKFKKKQIGIALAICCIGFIASTAFYGNVETPETKARIENQKKEKLALKAEEDKKKESLKQKSDLKQENISNTKEENEKKSEDKKETVEKKEEVIATSNTKKVVTKNEESFQGITSIREVKVMNGSKDKEIGKCGVAIFNKDIISEQSLIDFYNNKIKDSGYNYYTLVDSADKTKGMVFSGCLSSFTYGKIDDTYSVTNGISDGYIENNKVEYNKR